MRSRVRPNPEEATILHADLDSFYASVEQRDDPALRGRPVAVGGGIVLAASYEAKAFGVSTPMAEWRAKRLCPELVVVPPGWSLAGNAFAAYPHRLAEGQGRPRDRVG